MNITKKWKLPKKKKKTQLTKDTSNIQSKETREKELEEKMCTELSETSGIISKCLTYMLQLKSLKMNSVKSGNKIFEKLIAKISPILAKNINLQTQF